MPNYYDYGRFNGDSAGTPVEVDTTYRTQVYQVTHDGEGNYLPYMRRSFISFSFGGKNIEDFDLLAIIENNALQRKFYAEFNDNTTDSNAWNGQIYWSSHFNANTLDLTLFTDGIAEKQLDEVKRWFRPGRIEELVLAEHPNRAIMARVAPTPEYSMLPFEQEVTVMIGGESCQTRTTLYKGSIRLSFIMEEPFWYSRATILDRMAEEGEVAGLGTGSIIPNRWYDANHRDKVIYDDEDALKIVYEDGVPFSQMLPDPVEGEDTLIYSFGAASNFMIEKSLSLVSLGNPGDRAMTTSDDGTINGTTCWWVVNATSDLIAGDEGYFYYAGTAPASPIISFEVLLEFSNNGYISSINNSFLENNYNSFTITSVHEQTLKFTTPSVWTGYNQVINIFHNFEVGDAWEDVRVAIRDNVKHWLPRSFAMLCIDGAASQAIIGVNELSACITNMQKVFVKSDVDDIPLLKVSINCKKGIVEIEYKYYEDLSQSSLKTVTESAGDMICSDYLKIEDRNYPDEDGYIQVYSTEHPEYGYKYSCDCDLNNIKIEYKYMYY